MQRTFCLVGKVKEPKESIEYSDMKGYGNLCYSEANK